LSRNQVLFITHERTFLQGLGEYTGSTLAFVFAAAWICKYFSKRSTGSGLPEFKAILSGNMKRADVRKFFSFRVLTAKVVGLVLASGSSLSLGTEGPLIHISACIANFLMRNIPDFSDILENQSLHQQVLAASAAVGLSSAFNAPVGGLLFSVEITSTFYLVGNYYKSFIAAMAGAIACNLFLTTRTARLDSSAEILNMIVTDNPYMKWELLVFVAMGFMFGHLTYYYLQLNQYVSAFMRPYCKARPLVTCSLVAVLTCLIIFGTSAYNSDGMRVLTMISDVLTYGEIAEMHSARGMSPPLGLLISALSRAFLTLTATNLPIPAGIFVPNFLIGGLLGRLAGWVVKISLFSLHNIAASEAIYLPGYALVGAVAFASGVTHTISVGR
jgi:H+/Cl- antiporter ClcA